MTEYSTPRWYRIAPDIWHLDDSDVSVIVMPTGSFALYHTEDGILSYHPTMRDAMRAGEIAHGEIMINKSKYLRHYNADIDMASRYALTKLTAAQFKIVMDASRYISGDNEPKPGITCSVFCTDDQIADIDVKRLISWAVPGIRKELPLEVPATMYHGLQIRPTDPMWSLVVVDFDRFRVLLRTEVENSDIAPGERS